MRRSASAAHWQDTIAAARLCKPRRACHTCAPAGVLPCTPHRPPPDAHPARLILTLSLAPTIGLGIGRFAYALVLPDMRDDLGWSYSAAGFMNTINAVGYLVGALVASRLIQRFGLVGSDPLGNARLRRRAGAVRHDRAISSSLSLARLVLGLRRRGRLRRRRRARRDRSRSRSPQRANFLLSLFYAGPGIGILVLRADRAVHAAGISARARGGSCGGR